MKNLRPKSSPTSAGFTYLQEHDVVIKRPVVVQIVDQGFGDIIHLFHSLVLVEIMLTQHYFDQIVSADGRCFLLAFQFLQVSSFSSSSNLGRKVQAWPQYSRFPAVCSRHHPLFLNKSSSTVVLVVVLKRCLVFYGIRLDLLATDDPLL